MKNTFAKAPLFLSFFICGIISIILCANTIEYKYDAAGNRICRQVILLRSAVVDNQEDSIPEPPILSRIGQEQISFAPNPTRGLLHVSIITQDSDKEETQKELRLLLYSTNGALLQDHKFVDREFILDISDYAPGHYILKVFLDDTSVEFKIIKQ